jgi:DNA-binding transcriptional LysR family regulator
MKIEAFGLLDAVLRHGTMAAAAGEARLTASAVSIQMKKLEEYLGRQLFDRSGLQVKPLPLAFEVADVMRRATSEIERLRQPSNVEIEGTLRLGVIESMQPVLLPPAVQELRRRHPRLRLLPRRGKSAELTNAVKAGELDAAVVARPENGGSSRLSWHDLTRCELSLIVPPDEPETDLAILFARHEWICYDRRTIAGRLAARYIGTRIDKTSGDLELDAVRAIVAMVSSGLGVSIVQLSEPGLTEVFPVRVLKPADAPTLRFSMVTRRSDDGSRRLEILRRTIQRAARLSAKGRSKSFRVDALP